MEEKKQKIDFASHKFPLIEVQSLCTPLIKEKTSMPVYITNIVYDSVVPGGVILFGKTKINESLRTVCIKVEKVFKSIYFKKSNWDYSEELLNKLIKEAVISDFSIKTTSKKLFFNNKTVQQDCVKAKFVSKSIAVKNIFSENLYYSYRDDSIETALLKLNISVPGWVEVDDYNISPKQISNSKLDISCKTLHSLRRTEKQEELLTVLIIFDIWDQNSISEIHFSSFENVKISEFRGQGKTEKLHWPGQFKGEKEMLNYFLMKIYVIDPDVIYVTEGSEFLLRFISRIKNLSVKNWSRLGRIIRKRYPIQNFVKKITLGRTFVSSNATSPTIENFVKAIIDSRDLEVAGFISKTTGLELARCLNSGVLQKTEFLIVKKLHSEGFLYPPKTISKEAQKHKFKGGLVIDPKSGIYDYIVAMDFSSLYPSIIQEYQICITGDNLLSSIIETLVLKRSEINKEILSQTNPEILFLLQKTQKALKSLANSLYGSFSNEFFRFFYPSISEEISVKGREILQDAVDSIKLLDIDIIYGDTDSIMIKSGTNNYKDAFELSQFIEQYINQNYSFIRLRVENIYSKFFLLQKKNYSGIVAEKNSFIIKGLIRGNNSDFCQNLIRESLSILLNESFQKMDEFILLKIKNSNQIGIDQLQVKDIKTNKSGFMTKENGDIDINWYISKEILPFRNKVKQILYPDNEFFSLCTNKHKVFWFQDLQIVLDCKDCQKQSNISYTYSENTCSNITTLQLKSKIKALYTQPLKQEKKVMNCSSFASCSRLRETSNIFYHFCEFLKFNDFVKNFIEVSQQKLKIESLSRIFDSSSFFKIDLSRYRRKVDYRKFALRYSKFDIENED